jgi:hypothetical protein
LDIGSFWPLNKFLESRSPLFGFKRPRGSGEKFPVKGGTTKP